MVDTLQKNDFNVFTVLLKPNSGKVGLDQLAKQLLEYIDRHCSYDESFSLIGFSMGGLVSRYYLQRLDGIERVHRFIAISSPHHGTYTAYSIPNTGCRHMRPNSSFLESLNDDIERLDKVKPVSIWTAWDLMILPARSSIMPIGEVYHVPVILHALMPINKRCLNIILQKLTESVEADD